MKILVMIVFVITSMFSYLHSGDGKTYKVKEDSKGVKIFYNKNKPADPNFNIELKKIGEITSNQLDSLGSNGILVLDFDFDRDDNIIILDHNQMWKFSKTGRYINKWSRKGHGPGEIVNPFHFFILNGTTYVINNVSRKIIKFDSTGRFIDNIYITNSLDQPKDVFFAEKNFLLAHIQNYDANKEKCIDKIVTLDTKTMKVKKTLFTKEYEKSGSDWFAGVNDFIYTGDDNVFFVVENSFNDYKINCYDSNTGELKYKIRKNHIKVKSKEKDQIHYGFYKGEKVAMKTGTKQFQEAINAIFYDKHDRLWVNTNHRENGEDKASMYFDIFKDGVFFNRVKLDLNYNYIYGFKLNGNKIVEYGGDNNVYIYEFK